MDIRWMTRKDLPQVLEIERRSFEFPWTKEQFNDTLRIRPVVGLVAVEKGTKEQEAVLGYIVYKLGKGFVDILNLAVPPHLRRLGIGTGLVQKIISRSKATRRKSVGMLIRERNLEGQLFLREQGFKATKIVSGCYSETDEDAYHMRLEINKPNRFQLPLGETA